MIRASELSRLAAAVAGLSAVPGLPKPPPPPPNPPRPRPRPVPRCHSPLPEELLR